MRIKNQPLAKNCFSKVFVALVLLFISLHSVGSKAYTPASDNEVLEKLSYSPLGSKLRRLRDALAKDPKNFDLAMIVAGQYLERAQSKSDPRFYSYIEVALRPWWNLENPHPEILLMRATVKQFRHKFNEAILDLDKLLVKKPDEVRALVLRATLLNLQAKHDKALQDCKALEKLSSRITYLTCLASVESRNGKAKTSLISLKDILENPRAKQGSLETIKNEDLWALTIIADTYSRVGSYDEAENYYKKALALEPASSYLLAAYSDNLLAFSKPKKVIELLEPKDFKLISDNLLLRLALAYKQLASFSTEEEKLKFLALSTKSTKELAKRFKAAHERGDFVHEREEAIFALHLLGDSKRALELAEKNFQIQKEPIDLRIVLDAAVTEKDNGAIASVKAFLDKTALEDVYAEALLSEALR